MLCRDVAVHRVCEFCPTSGRCRSSRQWQRWGGSYTGAALRFSCEFLVKLAQKCALKIVLLLEAEFGLSFLMIIPQQMKYHAGHVPGSCCPHSCSLNNRFCVCPVMLKVLRPGQEVSRWLHPRVLP